MDPRRLENEDDEKFWEAWIKDELTFCYRYGKIGSPGGTKLKKFKTAAEAQAELEEKLKQKLAEGFVELGAEAEEEEAEEEEKEEEEDGDDEEEGGEEEAEEQDEDEDGDDEAPESEPPPPPPEPAKPTLPRRISPRATTAKDVDAVKLRLTAIVDALGGRSWRVRQRGKAASRALASLGGIDPESNAVLAPVFAGLMASVIAPKKRLALDVAMSLLWEVDAATSARTVSGWRAKMLASPASTSIGVLAATFEAVPDHEVALHTGAALVERHLPPEAWTRRFAKVAPFLEESLKTKGSTVARFLGSLRGDGDPVVKARLDAASGATKASKG